MSDRAATKSRRERSVMSVSSASEYSPTSSNSFAATPLFRNALLVEPRNLSLRSRTAWSSDFEAPVTCDKLARVMSRSRAAACCETRAKHAEAADCTAAAPMLPLRTWALTASSHSSLQVSMACAAAWKAASCCACCAAARARPWRESRASAQMGDQSTYSTAQWASAKCADSSDSRARAMERQAWPAPCPKSAAVASRITSAQPSATSWKALAAITSPLSSFKPGTGNA
mmetsp:Transcript_104061/g.333602  ORF Transcript_104061/g.333602 Transcript_104061/m.333602 type:complete len:230 (-) Transcript_104061:579-1268(-)